MARHPLKLTPDSSVLVIIDIQEKLVPAMPETERELAIAATNRLVVGAGLLGVPVVVTQQYSKGLGQTVAPLRESLEKLPSRAPVIEKICFSAFESEEFLQALPARSQVILTGMEAHICVYQTARAAIERGLGTFVALDAVCSRTSENKRIAESLYRDCGATVTSSETILFDWLGRAEGDAFKAVSKLVR